MITELTTHGYGVENGGVWSRSGVARSSTLVSISLYSATLFRHNTVVVLCKKNDNFGQIKLMIGV